MIHPLLSDFSFYPPSGDHVYPGPVVEMGKARLLGLRSLGHKVERFLSARPTVFRRIQSDERFSILRKWFGADPGSPLTLNEDGTFASAIRLDGEDLRLHPLLLPAGTQDACLSLWRATDPEARKVLPAPLAVPPDANLPLWFAMLRLRPLRPVWEAVLRRDHFESLLHTLPDAWLIDPTALPPGAVIPRLELADWKELPEQHLPRRSFAVLGSESGAPEPSGILEAGSAEKDWSVPWHKALDSAPSRPQLLMELPREAAGSWLVGFYEKKGGRVDARGFLGLRQSAEGSWQAHRVR